MMSISSILTAGVAMTLALGSAQASTLYSLPAPTLAMDTRGEFNATLDASAGAGEITFELQGFATLDGDNDWIDIFHLSVNGTEVFSGTWNLGGGGTDRILLNAPGATVSHTGLTVNVSVPLTLLGGTNTLKFAYESPAVFEGTTRNAFQGLGDEGWGINSITVTGAAAVPEPQTYGLFLAGLVMLGAALVRHKSAA
jgi:PEP-CTERM motif